MKINLILLAAGNSKRFNGNKLLTMYNGKPLYMYIIEKALNIDVNKIICVTQYEEIKEALSNTKINVVMNNNSNLGISSSIKLGVNFDNDADGYMFMVCDQPFIKEDTINKLLNTFINGDKGIVSTAFNGCTRNPVIFSKRYLNDLLSLNGDTGGSKIIKRNFNDLILVEVTNISEVRDIDTREEMKELSIE